VVSTHLKHITQNGNLDHFANIRDEHKKYLTCHHPVNMAHLKKMMKISNLASPLGYHFFRVHINLCENMAWIYPRSWLTTLPNHITFPETPKLRSSGLKEMIPRIAGARTIPG